MRVVHESAGDREVLATTVDEADSTLAQLRGLRFRSSIPDDYALVFDFDGQRRGVTDMLFVPFPIDAVWLHGEEVVRVETLPAWTGLAYVKSDGFVELPAGVAADVEEGDRVFVEESGSGDSTEATDATDATDAATADESTDVTDAATADKSADATAAGADESAVDGAHPPE